jgi:hypothetical protein
MKKFTSEQERAGHRCALTGSVTLRVWWSSGRTSKHTARSWQSAYDVISGEACPFERWEMTA